LITDSTTFTVTLHSCLKTQQAEERNWAAVVDYAHVTMAPSMYQSRCEWREARSPTLVIACADGRWRDHIEDFAANALKIDSAYDLLMVPGGAEPLALANLIPKDFNFLRRRLDMLVASHGIRQIVLIAHENCGWYRQRRIGSLTIDLKTRQLADLRQARARLQEWFDDVTVDTYFARLDGAPPRATFETV
jgi:hypothetical protein